MSLDMNPQSTYDLRDDALYREILALNFLQFYVGAVVRLTEPDQLDVLTQDHRELKRLSLKRILGQRLRSA